MCSCWAQTMPVLASATDGGQVLMQAEHGHGLCPTGAHLEGVLGYRLISRPYGNLVIFIANGQLQTITATSNFVPFLMLIQELNTAEDFISFYEEMIPLVQTLPQIVLHREKLFSALLLRVNMSARLSLEPILM